LRSPAACPFCAGRHRADGLPGPAGATVLLVLIGPNAHDRLHQSGARIGQAGKDGAELRSGVYQPNPSRRKVILITSPLRLGGIFSDFRCGASCVSSGQSGGGQNRGRCSSIRSAQCCWKCAVKSPSDLLDPEADGHSGRIQAEAQHIDPRLGVKIRAGACTCQRHAVFQALHHVAKLGGLRSIIHRQPDTGALSPRLEFKSSHFERDVILWAVRWYVAYPISYRQLKEMMEEYGVEVDHTTLNRSVIKYVPLLEREFRACKNPAGPGWGMDETYVRVKGTWKDLYRAVDKGGAAVDFLLTAKPDRGRVAVLAQGDQVEWDA
jgi:hypothetical protein